MGSSATTKAPFCCVLVSAAYHLSYATGAHTSNATESGFERSGVFLTLSPSALQPNRLELNWFGVERLQGSAVRIALYDEDPRREEHGGGGPILTADPKQHPQNYLTTKYLLPYLEDEKISSGCVHVFLARLEVEKVENGTGGKWVAASRMRCLRGDPSWMARNRGKLESVPVGRLMLPGTHDSAAYRKFDPACDMLDGLVYAQDLSLYQQLKYGVRYLDIRVIKQDGDDEDDLWLTHGFFKTHPLRVGLEDIARYLGEEQEIVVIDVHNLNPKNQWHEGVFRKLEERLREKLSSWWVKPGSETWKVTVKEVLDDGSLKSGQSRVIMTSKKRGAFDEKLFFPYIGYSWPNVNKIQDLKKYLDKRAELARGRPSSAVFPRRLDCQLTPKLFYLLQREMPVAERLVAERSAEDCKEEKSLRFHSHSSNRLVSTWWKTEYSDATSGAFAIVDFLLGSDMVDVAKVANGISEEAPITEGKNEIPTVTTTSAGTTTLQRSTAVQTTPEAPTARPTTLRARKTPASPGRAAEIATKGRSGKLSCSQTLLFAWFFASKTHAPQDMKTT